MSCKIIVHNPGIMTPGNAVSGKVICTFNTQEHIRGIKCKFRGREQTHWTERSGKNNVQYTGQNDFIMSDTNFIGEATMNPGVYEYNFAFALPPTNIPSSYNHQFGTIRYFLQANVDRPFAFDYKDEISIHVVAPVIPDSPVQNSQLVPVTYQAEKEIGCCCYVDFATLSLTLDRDSYVLGEVVNFKVHMDNKSDVEIQQMHAELVSNVQYVSCSPGTRYQTQKNIIALADSVGVEAHAEKTYNFSLKIPQTTIINNFTSCALFKQWCSLNIEARLPPFNSNVFLQANINLSHITYGNNIVTSGPIPDVIPIGRAPSASYSPVNRQPPYPVGPAGQATIPTAPIGDDDFSIVDVHRGNFELPPPSYDEIMKRDNPPNT